jgi:hypothetical protein
MLKVLRTIFRLSPVCLVLLLALPVQAATLNVDTNDPTCNDTTGGPYCTIQAAIDAASATDTVDVAAGTYAEYLEIDKALTLQGPNTGAAGYASSRLPEAKIVPPGDRLADGSNGEPVLLGVRASDVTIDGLEFNGDNPNVDSTDSGAAAYPDLNGVDVNTNTGILVPAYEGAQYNNVAIRNNIIRNLNWYGIYTGGLAGNSTTLSQGGVIERNYIDNLPGSRADNGSSRRGIGMFNEFYADIRDNLITRTRFGIQTGASSVAPTGSFPTSYEISGNTIEAERIGIWHNLYDSGTPDFSLDRNAITAAAGFENSVDGFQIVSISNNVSFSDNAVENSNVGMYFGNIINPVSIVDGSLFNNNIGIRANDFFNGPITLNISGISISNSSTAGIVIEDDSDTGANDNAISVTLSNSVLRSNSAANGIVLSDTHGPSSITVDVDDTEIGEFDNGILFEGGGTLDASLSDVDTTCFTRNVVGINNSDDDTIAIAANTFYDNTSLTAGPVTNNTPTLATASCVSILPVANDDVGSTTVNTPTSPIDVTANDTGNVDPTTVAIVGVVPDGSASVNSTTGEITFTPNLGFSGTTQFQYTVDQMTTGYTSNLATVTIDVTNAATGACSVVPDNAEIFEGDSFSLTVRCDDLSEDPFGVEVAHIVDPNSASITPPAFPYTVGEFETVPPAANFLASFNSTSEFLYGASLTNGGFDFNTGNTSSATDNSFTVTSTGNYGTSKGQTSDITATLSLDGNLKLSNDQGQPIADTELDGSVLIQDLISVRGSVQSDILAANLTSFNQVSVSLDDVSEAVTNPSAPFATGPTDITVTPFELSYDEPDNFRDKAAGIYEVEFTMDALGHTACIFTEDNLPTVFDNGATTLLSGDANDDDVINDLDTQAIAGVFNTTTGTPTETDINGDGTINVLDLVHVGRNFGTDATTDPAYCDE